MFVINDLKNPVVSGVALCLGNFDGFHIGHRLIVSTLKEEAIKIGAKTVIFTFYPHPVRFFGGEIKLLSTPRKRLELFEKQNVDYLVNAPFDKELSALPPEDFFKNIIVDIFDAKVIVVGKDYHFGAGKAGNTDVMAALGKKYGVKCIFVDKMGDGAGMEISSTAVRELLSKGHVDKVREFLGRPYSLEGEVIHGDGKGKDFGFPTINMDVTNELTPLSGVYSTDTCIAGKTYRSMTYVGTRPTVCNKLELRVETNIFDFNEDVYGQFAEVFFKEFIRGEMKFNSIEELKTQMADDLKKAANCR